ncbi:hypothetical protein PVK06_035527 [Gossypium arboreum]|uniref:Uncharacterized protein n=1 Tax=Gossypium arboreum TaxID=29729 RepID=A0ABR0NH11_GOSAR|nr:hypothetical protein PVK06_035527 [Gossypium arboreum]
MSVFIPMMNINVSIENLPQNGFRSLERHPNLALIMSNDITKAIRGYEALHHTSYHYDANTGEWVKSGHPTTNEDDNVKGAFEDIPTSKHAPSP